MIFFRQALVQLGAYNLKDEVQVWTERKIKSISIHPDYDKDSEAAYNDVAVFTFEKAVVFSDIIRPVCLPETPSDEIDHLSGSAVSVSGWGKIGNQATGPSETLKTAHIQVYNQR